MEDKTKQLVKAEVRKLRYKADLKRREADRLDKEADELEQEENK
uniref:Uncharacterized protein n=1 Tax=viral metagenome TaxID=1070528 RepID=A0A6M3JGV7_9ZZZZ